MTIRFSKGRGEPPPRAARNIGRAAAPPARVRSEALLGDAGMLIIEHGGREYRLRQTSTGKLILTA